MSKLKLMYDVINTMKDKEVISGTFKAEGKKDQTKIASFINEFEKNLLNGETKVKISTELNCEDKKVKHESQTEFTMQGCPGGMHHGMLKHFHNHHHNHHCGHNHDDIKCGGLKGKLTKLAIVLNIFNQIKVEEQEDKSIRLSLNLDEIPDELKKTLQEKMSHRSMPEHHQHHGFLKEFCTLKDPKIEANLWISKSKEVEKIVLNIDGKQIDELNKKHDMNLLVELSLV